MTTCDGTRVEENATRSVLTLDGASVEGSRHGSGQIVSPTAYPPDSFSGSHTAVSEDGSSTWRWAFQIVDKSCREKCEPLRISENGIKVIKTEEGFCPTPYDSDIGGKPCSVGGKRPGSCTIGYGHLIHTGPCTAKDVKNPKWRRWKDKKYADKQLRADLRRDHEPAVRKLAATVADSTPLNQCQYDALVDFHYNTGQHSTKSWKSLTRGVDPCTLYLVVRRLPDAALTAVGTKGKKHPDLIRRRQRESALWYAWPCKCGRGSLPHRSPPFYTRIALRGAGCAEPTTRTAPRAAGTARDLRARR